MADLRMSLADAGECTVIPGVYNALSARQAHEAGFDSLYLSSYALAAAHLALPDVGLVDRSEARTVSMLSAAAAQGADLITDVGGGFGNALGIARTVRELEQVGVRAIDIDDHVTDTCPHDGLMDQGLISIDEMCGRIGMITETRTTDFLVLVKLALRGTVFEREGRMLEEFERRAKAYAEAGADGIICGWLPDYGDYAQAVRSVGLPAIAIEVPFRERGSLRELADMGFSAVIHSLDSLYITHAAQKLLFETLYADGGVEQLREHAEFSEHSNVVSTLRFDWLKDLVARHMPRIM